MDNQTLDYKQILYTSAVNHATVIYQFEVIQIHIFWIHSRTPHILTVT